jgi:hypothetical protein
VSDKTDGFACTASATCAPGPEPRACECCGVGDEWVSYRQEPEKVLCDECARLSDEALFRIGRRRWEAGRDGYVRGKEEARRAMVAQLAQLVDAALGRPR